MTQEEMKMVARLHEVLSTLCKRKEDEVTAYMNYILTGKVTSN